MSCEYVREYYGVPAEIGRRVIVHGKLGIIAEDRGHYIGVNFDTDKPGVVYNAHPTDCVEYKEMGKIRPMTRAQARYQEYLRSDGCFDDFKHFLQYKARQRKEKGLLTPRPADGGEGC
jgi:hypothetical protein